MFFQMEFFRLFLGKARPSRKETGQAEDHPLNFISKTNAPSESQTGRFALILFQLIKFRVFFFQIVQIISGVERFPGDLPDPLVRRHDRSTAEYVFLHPVGDLIKFSVCDRFVYVEIHFHPVQDLRAVGVAERIGGEITEHSRPVYVLEAALSVVFRFDAEVFLVLLIPQSEGSRPP